LSLLGDRRQGPHALASIWDDEDVLEPLGCTPACDFVAIDFETATSSRDSACALGLVYIEDGERVGLERTLIRPPGNRYDSFNISIHGVTPDITAGAPTFAQVWPLLEERFAGRPLVAHNASFDMSVLGCSLRAAGLAYPRAEYYCYCSMPVSRSHWPQLSSHKLDLMAYHLGVSLLHHDPADDANAAAQIMLRAMREDDACSIVELAVREGIRPGRLYPGGYDSCGFR